VKAVRDTGSQATLRDWNVPEEHRPWPNVESTRQCLADVGLRVDELKMEPLGARTVGVIAQRDSREIRFSLVRQRCSDPRVVCPLHEEFEALQQVSKAHPGLVPDPLAMIKPDGGDELLVLSWVAGRRVGSRVRFERYADRIAQH